MKSRKVPRPQVASLDAIFKELGFKKLAYPPRNHFDALAQQEDLEGPSPVSSNRSTRKDNSCGKACYTSKTKAKEAINYRLKRGADTSKLRSYFCDVCKAWHMTKSFHSK